MAVRNKSWYIRASNLCENNIEWWVYNIVAKVYMVKGTWYQIFNEERDLSHMMFDMCSPLI